MVEYTFLPIKQSLANRLKKAMDRQGLDKDEQIEALQQIIEGACIALEGEYGC